MSNLINYYLEKKDYIQLSFILLILILFILIIDPSGEFPFGDDVFFIKPVKILLDEGRLTITDWTSMTLIMHILIGAFVTKLFGFSIFTLRLITIFFHIIGVCGFYKLLKSFTNKNFILLFATFLFAFHPIYYLISFSYNTDVCFTAFSIWTFIFYLKFLQHEKITNLIYAVILNIISILVRDIALFYPLAFLIVFLLKEKIDIQKNPEIKKLIGKRFKYFLIALAPICFACLSYLIFKIWLNSLPHYPAAMDFSKNKFLDVWTRNIVYTLIIYGKNLIYTTIYFGFFISPLTILYLKNKYALKIKYSIIIIFSLTCLFLLIISLIEPKIYDSLTGLLISTHNLHNFYFSDIHEPSRNYIFTFPIWLTAIYLIFGLASGIILIYWLVNFIIYDMKIKKIGKNDFQKLKYLFLILNLLLYLFPTYSMIIFNRYLILPSVIIIILIIGISSNKIVVSRNMKIISSIFLLLLTYYSVSAAKDMMNYNRTNLEAINYLEITLKIKASQIDGGFEFNAWNFYDNNYKMMPNKNWWWVKDDEYKISWGECKNYSVLKVYEYLKWFPPGFKSKIFILKRNKSISY